MTNIRLGQSLVERANARVAFLRQMRTAGLHADVVRESQEVVELALKGLLRIVGIDPPKEHDVSKILTASRDRLPKPVTDQLPQIRRISKRLRRERELAFYGDEDFVPSDEYDSEDSAEALEAAEAVVGWVMDGVRALDRAR
jgi:HEPN domain-containing protein